MLVIIKFVVEYLIILVIIKLVVEYLIMLVIIKLIGEYLIGYYRISRWIFDNTGSYKNMISLFCFVDYFYVKTKKTSG